MRRGIWIDTYENDFGQYWHELSDPASPLHEFRPTSVLLGLDAHDLTAGVTAAMDAETAAAALADVAERIRSTWRLARRNAALPGPASAPRCRCIRRC